MSLQGSALNIIDEHSRIKARNRYYWIAGLDGSDSMIFGRVFYTVDVYGTRIVYFSHWINSSSSNRSTLSPCQGCSLHDASIVDGPLQVRSVGFKLTHRQCLTFLSSYRCLQLFHMPTRIDSTCYSRICVPELFSVDPGSFLWTNGPISSQASELGFIVQVLRLLPNNCSINFYSTHLYATLYEDFSGSSPERRVRLPCYLLWMAIHNK
ncbi:unnamed protein product [Rhizophagus irregularis]|nr:unnamed protein product [Rhizophagus irregularis]